MGKRNQKLKIKSNLQYKIEFIYCYKNSFFGYQFFYYINKNVNLIIHLKINRLIPTLFYKFKIFIETK